jgi:hypothetical protein
MPPKRLRITCRQTRGAIRWAVLAALVSVPLFFVSRLLLPGVPDPAVWLPREIGRR